MIKRASPLAEVSLEFAEIIGRRGMKNFPYEHASPLIPGHAIVRRDKSRCLVRLCVLDNFSKFKISAWNSREMLKNLSLYQNKSYVL